MFCPCALVLAPPTAVMAAIGSAAKHGFLVREGDSLERLSKVKVTAFDKTGTLTCCAPSVAAVESVSPDFTKEEIYRLAASAEQLSEHPLGKAIVSSYKKEQGAELMAAEDFAMFPGRGITERVNGRKIAAGNLKLLREHNVEAPEQAEAEERIAQGCTVIYVAADGTLAGFIALADTLRKESAATIKALSCLGAGIYYLVKEKNDSESRRIYTAVSAVGAVVTLACVLLLIFG